MSVVGKSGNGAPQFAEKGLKNHMRQRLSVRKRGGIGIHTSRTSLIYVLSLSLVGPLIAVFAQTGYAAAAQDHNLKRVVEIAEALKKQFGITSDVDVKIIQSNRLGFSVAPLSHQRGQFVLSIDEQLLSQLDEEELTAALGHELGHVWIYTHHPYLHTEIFANQVAMRVVNRESLKKLYLKLWAFQGTTGDIRALLGADDGFDQ
jgi:hypothetical protein